MLADQLAISKNGKSIFNTSVMSMPKMNHTSYNIIDKGKQFLVKMAIAEIQ
jgi:hypothetical protein